MRGRQQVKTEWVRLDEIGDFVEGELRAFEEKSWRFSDHPVDVVVLSKVDRLDDIRRMVVSPRMRIAIDEAKRIGWPVRRVYVRFEFRGVRDVEVPGKDLPPRTLRMRDIDCQVALLLAYDLKVDTMEDLKKVRADDVRVLVKETDIIYRIDARGSNHLPSPQMKPSPPARAPTSPVTPAQGAKP